MRSGLIAIALAVAFSAGCLSPDPQPARPVAQKEVAEIEHDDDAPGLVKKPVAELSKVKVRPDKDNWNNKKATKIGEEGIEIDLGKVEHSTRLEVVFSNSVFMKVTFFNGSEQVGSAQAAPRVGVLRKKLVIRRVKVPKSAVEKGYDRVVITPKKEKRLSVARVRVLPPAEAKKWDDMAKGGGKPKQPKAPAATGAAAAQGAAPAKPAPAKPAAKPAG